MVKKKDAKNTSIPSFDDMQTFVSDMHNLFLKSHQEFDLVHNELFFGPQDVLEAFQKIAKRSIEHPEDFTDANRKLMMDTLELCKTNMVERIHAADADKQIIKEKPGDKRFADPSWNDHPSFNYMKQSYLLYARWIEELVEAMPDLEGDNKMRIKFISRQLVDAMSPSNFPWSNPKVMRKAIATNGENLKEGFLKLLGDIHAGNALMNIENTDTDAFKVGVDVALTPGKVVFENELMQLIQYTPTTKKVAKIPVLLTPAWINKFYILDLRPDNSFVKWLVSQGHTVFVVSWVNPGHKHLDVTFDDYLKLGAMKAVETVKAITGEKKIHSVGYCLGGILMTTLLGYWKEEASEHFESFTLMASPLEFSEAGELLLFTDEKIFGLLSRRIEEKGMLDGDAMGGTFNLLRANDLIWSAYINNYLLSNAPPQFDMLYWNADVTNLPAKMFMTYIEELFQKNNLIKKNKMKVLGKTIDISQNKVPVFLLGTHDDHIAPWRSIYGAAKSFGGKVKFVLSGSGHVAGVVNPPAKKKYGYWENGSTTVSADNWLAKAKNTKGSWWTSWQKWVSQFDKEFIDANKREPGKGTFKAIEEAPGRYVRVSAAQALAEKSKK